MAKTTRKKQTQKATSAGRSRTARKKEPTTTYEVGQSVSIPPEDAATIKAAEGDVLRLQQLRGALRGDYTNRDREIEIAIGQAQGKLRELVQTAGSKVEVPTTPDSGQNWRFAIDQMQFTRLS